MDDLGPHSNKLQCPSLNMQLISCHTSNNRR